jgi:hypothetical protein
MCLIQALARELQTARLRVVELEEEAAYLRQQLRSAEVEAGLARDALCAEQKVGCAFRHVFLNE